MTARAAPKGRLGNGQLRRQVAEYLASHPGPHKVGEIAKALGKSAGAVGNALTTLAGNGEADLVPGKPIRYETNSATAAAIAPKAPLPTRPNGQVYQPCALADMPDVEALRKLRDAGVPALPYGPPGTGKTSLVEAAFPDLITVAGVGDTTTADLVGEYTQKPRRHLHLRIRAAHQGHAGEAGPLHRRRHLGQPGGAGGRLPRDGRREITVKAHPERS
ncbi:MAG: hypothetical protein ABSF03_34910 [Streptosporangiaceae bacterium]|jgi:hypothetical protein